ncbi:hypothetical protein PH5382_03174 [Phaeobacter sp. CECT 5382]|uniref:hypothetical protein n=1 Tax=Phaeobacter sp. CECT 5382 TaxID=1712645 RepID=UPI0006DA4CFE|nr:hypothetical protein [Phaeobacter sp. CECT 5382]CUH89228.1 hypothetical protein PH5382_03174 [Phaeobacter sp. CECT 5382]
MAEDTNAGAGGEAGAPIEDQVVLPSWAAAQALAVWRMPCNFSKVAQACKSVKRI